MCIKDSLMTFMKGGTTVTLRELLVAHDLPIPHSEEVGSLKVVNYEDFCPWAIETYFQSKDFREDLECLEQRLVEPKKFGFIINVLLVFERDENQNLHLRTDLDL